MKDYNAVMLRALEKRHVRLKKEVDEADATAAKKLDALRKAEAAIRKLGDSNQGVRKMMEKQRDKLKSQMDKDNQAIEAKRRDVGKLEAAIKKLSGSSTSQESGGA